MKRENMNQQIDKIEEALIALSQNPKGSFVNILKERNIPYFGNITSILSKKGILVKDGARLRWVDGGPAPNRTLAATIYEECKDMANPKNKPRRLPSKAQIAKEAIHDDPVDAPAGKLSQPTINMQKALALMEKAIVAGVKDPVSFVESVLKDPRI